MLLVWPFTWNGAGGPTGNRYLLGIYPALLFLMPPGNIAWAGIARLAWRRAVHRQDSDEPVHCGEVSVSDDRTRRRAATAGRTDDGHRSSGHGGGADPRADSVRPQPDDAVVLSRSELVSARAARNVGGGRAANGHHRADRRSARSPRGRGRIADQHRPDGVDGRRASDGAAGAGEAFEVQRTGAWRSLRAVRADATHTCCRRARRKALFPSSGIRPRPPATTGTSGRCCGLPPFPLPLLHDDDARTHSCVRAAFASWPPFSPARHCSLLSSHSLSRRR